MPKLTDLEITKVAFVPVGDNKRARVMMFKRKPEETSDKKKGHDEMETIRIDKSKLTADEISQLDAMVLKAGTAEDPEQSESGAAPDNAAAEKADNGGASARKAAVISCEPEAGGDIYKGLHPAVVKELKELRKRAEAAEDRELTGIAKKYELLGKKPEELAKTLKTLKAAGGSAYEDMIGVLDASLAAVEKSGVFSEIGSSRSGQTDAWTMIERHADEIMKAAPNMTRSLAIEKACEQHPELVAEYEANR